MAEKRRRFSPQFKAEAVQMVIGSGRAISDVARDLGIERQTLNKWVNDYQRAHLGRSEPFPRAPGPASGVPRSREEELEAEVRRLRLENEFLKKPRPSSPRPRSSSAVRAGVIASAVGSTASAGRAVDRGRQPVNTGDSRKGCYGRAGARVAGPMKEGLRSTRGKD